MVTQVQIAMNYARNCHLERTVNRNVPVHKRTVPLSLESVSVIRGLLEKTVVNIVNLGCLATIVNLRVNVSKLIL